jgi:hypothetical protein
MRLLKLNADEAPQLAAELGVSGIPVLLLLRGGRIRCPNCRGHGYAADRYLGTREPRRRTTGVKNL